MPHGVRLRMAMQQQKGRTLPAPPRVQRASRARYVLRQKTFKHQAKKVELISRLTFRELLRCALASVDLCQHHGFQLLRNTLAGPGRLTFAILPDSVDPLSRGGKPVCCVSRRPLMGDAIDEILTKGVEFLRRAL